jgi:murein DD-endopeptidase MepM/ murein hydrolase activator NlpD
MALNLADRLLTIVVTAGVTSAAWLVAGSTRIGTDLSSAAENVGSRVSGAASWQGSVAKSVAQSIGTLQPAAGGGLVIPVAGVERSELSDSFSDVRGGGTRVHQALDIMAPTGTPVIAAGPGTVEKLFVSADGGNTIYIRSADRSTIHYYAHLDRYAPSLVEGRSVRAGEALGTVGATGNADPSSPHLHFAVMRTSSKANWWEPATAINPYTLLADPR